MKQYQWDNEQHQESGFILITSLVLLAILTLLGMTAAYKTVIETKVSRMVVQMDRASAAADTGLTQAYWYWVKDTVQGVADAQTLKNFIVSGSGGAAIAPYEGSFTPESLDDLKMPTDADIQNPANQFFVFDVTSTGITKVANSTWGKGTNPQVAVWVTSFNDETPPVYPYQTPVDLTVAGAACAAGCKMVTYALGRSGQARQMVRESQSVINNLLTGVSAMTNAPSGVNFADICNPPATPPANLDANASPWSAGATGNGSTVIEVTQAPYALGSVPSGTALASNTSIGSGGKGFRNGTGSQTGATFESVPYLLYTGHGTKTAFKVDWAATQQDTTGVDLPANLLPQKLVNAPLLGTTAEVDYFANPNSQLFDMDTYRWAAEQFTCQTAPFTPANDGQFGNGIYCSKAEALRLSVDAIVSAASGGAVRAFAPVTGRLNIAQIQYNIANGIPMFGIVRLMFPAVPDSGVTATCNGTSTQLHVIESAGDASNGSYDFNKLMACGKDCAYTGSIIDPYTLGGQYPFTVADGAVPDNDGDLGSNARLIVYGGLLIDYFADYDIQANPTGGSPGAGTDTVFNPAGGERLLSPLESPDVYLAIEHNVMINPVMPRFMGNNPLPFPTAAPQTNPNANATSPSRLGNAAPAVGSAATNTLVSANSVNMVDLNDAASPMQGNAVNLASPYDGYFPWSEGMLPPQIGESPAGTMRLQSRATVADNPSSQGLVAMVASVGSAGEQASLPTLASSLLSMSKPVRVGQVAGIEADVLRYYYDLMAKTLDQKNANDWPVAGWPGNGLTAPFCIGAQDCLGGDNTGDKIHLMFPTGYMHGWKVALAALDITADEWNHVLTGGAAPRVGIADAQGLYSQLLNSCSQDGLLPGAGCPMGLPYNFGVDQGGWSQGVVQGIQDGENQYFNVTQDAATGYGLLDSKWRDIPATMYSGGLLDMHAHSNMNGIIYTPGPLEWEPGNSGYDTGIHISYVNGSIITGYGAYTKNKTSNDRYVLVYDQQAVDNINVNQGSILLLRYDHQGLN